MHTRAPVVVGRDEELRVLDRMLADAGAHRGGAVFLVGEPRPDEGHHLCVAAHVDAAPLR